MAQITTRQIVLCENLSISYPGNSPTLTDVTLDVEKGEFLALIGPNGAGKSTFLKAILGQLTTKGKIHTPHQHRIGYVPQSTSIDPTFPIDAKYVVRMGILLTQPWWKRLGKKEKDQADEALKKVGLYEQRNTQFGALSGGQQQRVLLARALAKNPELILLDEPFNGLDQPNRDALITTIEELKTQGVSIIAATHDLGLVHGIAEKVALFNHRLVAFGSTEEIMRREILEQAYGAGYYV